MPDLGALGRAGRRPAGRLAALHRPGPGHRPGLDGQVANSATLFTVLGLSFAGGLLIPDSQLPHAVREISTALPSRQLADLARAAAAGHQPSIAGAGILVLWTLALRRRDGAA